MDEPIEEPTNITRHKEPYLLCEDDFAYKDGKYYKIVQVEGEDDEWTTGEELKEGDPIYICDYQPLHKGLTTTTFSYENRFNNIEYAHYGTCMYCILEDCIGGSWDEEYDSWCEVISRANYGIIRRGFNDFHRGINFLEIMANKQNENPSPQRTTTDIRYFRTLYKIGYQYGAKGYDSELLELFYDSPI